MKPNLKPYMEPGRMEAGCDEAGRGPLAGPVVAAAVAFCERTASITMPKIDSMAPTAWLRALANSSPGV